MVGPNGSGKSNVIDAMLFVFGKRAKQLRLNKVSELIHNSTDFRNLQYARVEVHFHELVDSTTDEEAFQSVTGSDFVISREAYKNNTSKYFIDEKTSSFTEVTTLLKTHGVDLNNNRFLILQGEVEQISMMKPKAQNPRDEGLLEYLEDIIGTNQYVESIEEKAKSLEALNEQRGGQVNRLKLVEKERDALGGAVMFQKIMDLDAPPDGLLIKLKAGPGKHIKDRYYDYVKALKTEMAHIERLQSLQKLSLIHI